MLQTNEEVKTTISMATLENYPITSAPRENSPAFGEDSKLTRFQRGGQDDPAGLGADQRKSHWLVAGRRHRCWWWWFRRGAGREDLHPGLRLGAVGVGRRDLRRTAFRLHSFLRRHARRSRAPRTRQAAAAAAAADVLALGDQRCGPGTGDGFRGGRLGGRFGLPVLGGAERRGGGFGGFGGGGHRGCLRRSKGRGLALSVDLRHFVKREGALPWSLRQLLPLVDLLEFASDDFFRLSCRRDSSRFNYAGVRL